MMKLSAPSLSSVTPALRGARRAPALAGLACAALLALLSGCDQLGIEDPSKVAAAKEAEGKAIGGACRNALRAIEDCYTLNPKAQKAAMYEGWREMDEYMRENKLEGTRPVVPSPAASKASAPASDADDSDDSSDKPSKSDKSSKGGKSSH